MSLLDVWVLFLVLGTVAVFAAGVWVLSRLAGRHVSDDPGAKAKVLVAIAFSLLLGVAGAWVLVDYQGEGEVGTHNSFTAALNKTIGEGDYLEATKVIPSKQKTLDTIILPNLARYNATIDAYVRDHPEAASAIANKSTAGLPPEVAENVTKRAESLGALTLAKKEMDAARITVRKLSPNHALWLKVEPLVREGRDNEAEELVMKALDPTQVTQVLPMNDATVANDQAPCARDAATGACTMPLTPKAIEHAYYDAHELRNVPVSEGAPAAFEHQREFNHQMDAQLKLFAYPAITGLVMAPFAFAGGSILRRAYVPSDTVGFKPYPGKSAGFFLLFMGLFSPLMILGLGMPPTLDLFALFAIPFAAWVLYDLHKRSVEGQINL